MFYCLSMFSYKETLSHLSPPNVAIWLSMAFQAGTINTGGYLACHRFVSHVTGFGTLVGEEAAIGNYTNAAGMAMVPIFFIVGAMLSAFLVDRRIQRDRAPLYPVVMFLTVLLTLAVSILGSEGFFGSFGAPFSGTNDYILLAILCLTCGLLNATVTSAFGAVIRITHLTGITTDMAIGVVRVLTHSHKIRPRDAEIRANFMRASLIGSFMIGSYISALAYQEIHFWGFLIPCGIATILFFWSLIHFWRI